MVVNIWLGSNSCGIYNYFKGDFLMDIKSILQSISDFVWGAPLLILLVGTGIYLTLRLKCLQIRRLPLALKYVFGKDEEENDNVGTCCHQCDDRPGSAAADRERY